jgi:predicted Rdx family selenoprotein
MGDLIVRVDDVTVFDHKKDGDFPGNDELLRRISAAGATRPAM